MIDWEKPLEMTDGFGDFQESYKSVVHYNPDGLIRKIGITLKTRPSYDVYYFSLNGDVEHDENRIYHQRQIRNSLEN